MLSPSLSIKQNVNLWVENLPKANIVKSSELVCDYVNQLIQSGVTPHDLFDSIELFNPVTAYLRQELQVIYFHDLSASKSEQLQAVNLAKKLAIHFATAYAFILQSLIKAKEKDPYFYALLIERCIAFLTQVLIVCYQNYQAVPEHLWTKLHKLYLHAEKYDLENLKINDHIEQTHQSIENAYKHALLLASADLYHLRIKDSSKINQALYTWSALTTLDKQNFTDDLFVVHLDKDEPPIYQSLSTHLSQHFYIRGFNTQNLVNYIRSIVFEKAHDAAAPKQSVFALKKDILQYLVNVWGAPFNRKHPRVTQTGKLTVCFGIAAIYHFLGGSDVSIAKPPTPSEKKETFQPLSLQPIELELDADLVADPAPKQAYYDPWEHLSKSLEQVDTHEITASRCPKFHQYEWQIDDSSPEGYCLLTQENLTEDLQSGELVGLQNLSPKNTNPWLIGVIRWLQTQDHETKLGIKLLSPSASPISIKVERVAPNTHLKAILLPAFINLGLSSSLILPPLSYIVGERALIINKNIQLEIIFTKILTHNDCYCQTEYDLIQTIVEEDKAEETAEKNKNNMDTIWDKF